MSPIVEGETSPTHKCSSSLLAHRERVLAFHWRWIEGVTEGKTSFGS